MLSLNTTDLSFRKLSVCCNPNLQHVGRFSHSLHVHQTLLHALLFCSLLSLTLVSELLVAHLINDGYAPEDVVTGVGYTQYRRPNAPV